MSGQFQQRRLSRPAFQLDVLDAFAENDGAARRRRGRPGASCSAARRRHEELRARARRGRKSVSHELRALVEDTAGLEPGTESDLRGAARAAPPRSRSSSPVRPQAADALAPDDGEGAAGLAAAPSARLRRSSRSRRSSRARATTCATSSCACARRRRSCVSFLAGLARRARAARADRGRARAHLRREASFPLRHVRRAARARGGSAGRARGARRRRRPGARPPPTALADAEVRVREPRRRLCTR